MTLEELDRLYETFRRSVFRLETLEHYSVPDDGPRLEAWRRGEQLPVRPGKQRWLNEVREMVAAGQRVYRVHIVTVPVESEYVRYELDVYRENVQAGEEVFIADRAHPSLAGLNRDFLLFDAETDNPALVWFNYDEEGHLRGYERETDPKTIAACTAQRDRVLSVSVPLDKFSTAA